MAEGAGEPGDAARERTLAERFARARDEAAFRELYRLHTPRLYRMARRLLGDGAGAEDVIQETWVRAAERLGAFRWEAALATWLGGIAINCCREHLRARRRAEGPPVAAEPMPASPAPGAHLDLGRAVLALADGYREVLVLHDVYGHTHEEIGTLLGIEAGTSKSQLSRARRAVREALRGGGQGDRR